jgi:glutamate--cysteine ligase
MADWKLHLNTLFPEARLKNTLEIRPCDSLPPDLFCAVPALCAGLLYDEQALSEAEALANELSLEDVHAARPELVRVGLEAAIGRRSARALAERVIDIAMGGLERRGRLDSQGRDERVHLEPLKRLVEQGLTPADRLTQGLPASGEALRAAILERTRIGLREAL